MHQTGKKLIQDIRCSQFTFSSYAGFGIIRNSCNYKHQLFHSLQYLHTTNITNDLKFLTHRVACVSQSTSTMTASYQMDTFPVSGLYPFQIITLIFPPLTLNAVVLRYHDYSAVSNIGIFKQEKFIAKIQILN